MAVSASDLRAVLALPGAPAGPTAAQKKSARKEQRVRRELAALVGPRAAPSLAVASRPRLKAKPRLGGGAVKWEQREFANGARKDGLKFQHWVKADADPEAEYPFQKYDVPTAVFSYTDEEYDRLLTSDEWTREETDYLFDMLREYDLRWFVVHDRWDFPGGAERALEDLKDRYCVVCRRLLRARPSDDNGTGGAVLREFDFDREREAARRAYLRALAARTPAQAAEEEALFLELRRLEQRERAFRRDRDALLRTLRGVESGLPDVVPLDDDALAPAPGERERERERKRRRADDGGAPPATPVSAGAGLRRAAASGEDDEKHCIVRASPPPGAAAAGLTFKTGGHQAAYVRGWRLPHPKPALVGKVTQALVELGVPMIGDTTHLPEPAAPALGRAGDGVGAGAALRSRTTLGALAGVLGVLPPESKRGKQLYLRLVMPTRENCVQLERVLDGVALLVETKRAVDQVEYDIMIAKEQLRMRRDRAAGELPARMDVDEDEGESASVSGVDAGTDAGGGTGRGHRRRRSTMRSASVSSVDTTATSAMGQSRRNSRR